MKKTLIIAGTALALAVPVASAADQTPSAKQTAHKLCKAERAADKAAFKAKYGTTTKKKQNGQNAYRNCVRQNAGEAQTAVAEAREACAAHKTAEKGKGQENNAYGKCVSGAVRTAVQEQVETFKNAAQECRDERGDTDESKTAFRETYGTNANKKNAFGKCVSGKVKEQEQEQEQTETEQETTQS
jgi:hypothetical protein